MKIILAFETKAEELTALASVLAEETVKEQKIKTLLAFYLVVASFYFKTVEKNNGLKLLKALYNELGRPKEHKQIFNLVTSGKAGDIEAYPIPIKEIDDPKLRRLARLLTTVESKKEPGYQEISRLAGLVTDPSVVSLWAPKSIRPTTQTHKDPKERQKALNRHMKDVLIGLVRANKSFPDILTALDQELGKKVFSRVPKTLVKHLSVNELGELFYDNEPVTSHAGAPTKIWILIGKIELPVRSKESGYVFQYKPVVGDTYQKVYRQSSVKESKKEKWGVVNSLMENLPKIKTAWKKLLAVDDPLGAVLQFAYLTSARIGTPGNNTFGITTLQARHFTEKGPNILVKYHGKGQSGKAVEQEHLLKPNPETRDLIRFIKKRIGVTPADQTLFSNDGKPLSNIEVNGWLQRYIPGMSVHKFRHLRGTSLATEILEKLKVPANVGQGEAQRLFKAAMEKVGKALGHYNIRGDEVKVSSSTALKHYISPEIGLNWFKKLGLSTPKFLPQV